MEPIVLDSNLLAASFLEFDLFHQRGQAYIDGLENGDYVLHLPMLIAVEVMSTISRRALKNRLSLMLTWRQNLADWELDGKIILYPLDRNRMENSLRASEQYRLRGADSIIAALADELGMPLKTFDREILARYLQASV